MIGRVIKIFSDFYYVQTEFGLVEAKLRTILKKQKLEIVTGDFVELTQFNSQSMQAYIIKAVNRINIITKPKAANITQTIIVSALKEPDLNYEQLNRYIAFSEYNKINPILCFNKEDIENNDDLKNEIFNIYDPLGYKIIFTSALAKTGMKELTQVLLNNTSLLCGSSGAGKSSLINSILNNYRLKTKSISEKNKKGTHTTRHCELIEIAKDSYIVDTPGFSRLKFDFILPVEIQKYFREFNSKILNCKYNNCLHLGENECSASEIIGKMHLSRLESYKKLISEAEEFRLRISKQSIKEEKSIKYNKNKIMTKISEKKRNTSRKTAKQKIYKEENNE